MTTRQRIWIFVLVAIVVAALAFWFAHTREPRYQGKNLTTWLRELQNPGIDGDVTEQVKAVESIGTNAIPFLLEMVQAQDSEWKLRFDGWISEAFGWKLNTTSVADRHNMASAGFSILGSLAEPVVPTLATWLANTNESHSAEALLILGRIGSESAMAVITQALTNQSSTVRSSAAYLLGSQAGKGAKSVPALLRGLNDSALSVRAAAARSLGQIALEPDIVVPALTNTLNDPEQRVRNSAAAALASFGTGAIAALPTIQQLDEDTDSNPRGRMSLPRVIIRIQCEIRDGGIIRGPKGEKKIALVFTGHEFAEGGETILRELSNHDGHASFFLTGTFLENTNWEKVVKQIVKDGHYLGPHSDKHLLYCSWEKPNPTLPTRREFIADLGNNVRKIENFRTNYFPRREFFLPAFEHYNREIADWSRTSGRTLINYTPGTRSNADYTGEADKNFVSSQAIFDSIVKHEQEDPNGLNGFILLLHIGVGPNRADKFHNRFRELLDYLTAKGYQFVRVDELLEPKGEAGSFQRQFPNPNSNAPFRRR